MVPFITSEIAFRQYVCELVFGIDIFVSMAASWFLVSMYLIWIFSVQIDSIEQPIKRNSVGSGNMSHCGAASLYDHLDHCFDVFKHIQQSFLITILITASLSSKM